MKSINIAIAGFGYSAKVFHLPFLTANPRFQIKKVYERTSNNAKNHLPEVEIVRNFEQLLTDEIDLVIITTPNQTHYQMAKQAITAGKNVLVEKPLVPTQAQAQELMQLAHQHKVQLSIYQNRRWDNAIATAKEILNKGLIGEVVDCEIRFERYAKSKNPKVWKETGEQGTGLVYDLGVHLLDSAVYLFGLPSEIFADIRYQHAGSQVDDNFSLNLYYPTGLKVVLSASKYVRETGNHFALHGTLGSYCQPLIDPQENWLTSGQNPTEICNGLQHYHPAGILHTEINGEVVRYAYPNATASYQDFYDNLYLALSERQPLAVTAEQASQVLGLIETAFNSAKQGRKLPCR